MHANRAHTRLSGALASRWLCADMNVTDELRELELFFEDEDNKEGKSTAGAPSKNDDTCATVASSFPAPPLPDERALRCPDVCLQQSDFEYAPSKELFENESLFGKLSDPRNEPTSSHLARARRGALFRL